MFEYILNKFKIKEMRERALEMGPSWSFDLVPEDFKPQAM